MTWTDAINGVFTTIAVDSLDRPVNISLPGSGIAPVTAVYTPQGQIASMTQASVAASHVETFQYYPSGPSAGLLESETDPAGLTTSYQYDPAGRVVKEVLPDGSTVGFSYDADGNLITVVPPGEPAHDFTYDAVNQTASDTSPTVTGSAPLAFHYTYNLDRQLTGIAYPDGTTVS
ncbi:YD repeat protein, partial [mine drainage metagenome]